MICFDEPEAPSGPVHVYCPSAWSVVGPLGDMAQALGQQLSITDTIPRSTLSLQLKTLSTPTDVDIWERLLCTGWPRPPVLYPLPGRTHEVAAQHPRMRGYCHPAVVMAALSTWLGAKDVVVLDTGDVTLWAAIGLCLAQGTRCLLRLQCAHALPCPLPLPPSASPFPQPQSLLVLPGICAQSPCAVPCVQSGNVSA